jgi:hypothetical protein
MKFKHPTLLLTLLLVLPLISLQHQDIKTVRNYEELAEHHCSKYPIELIWRVASGFVSEKYGEEFFDYDCYIRHFIRKGS